jgi:ABC-2 type transport system ATP-binding protein
VRVRFHEPIDGERLGEIPGVAFLKQDDQQTVLLQVEGEMDGLIKSLAAHTVVDFETEQPSLEEIFLAYYKGDA